ncbi:short-chain dehydrogenase [Podospora fimiseda]|uniref:Short-chain dehydrogenase n=1 Tax=Podospora fimiseda TaxID=252190 RepID=A0AAN6YQA1_9PEZI|nr:short-chain dehydrogenase [Podospora fimiseda]
MDPLTAVSLAGVIVQFVEVGTKTAKRLSDFRDHINAKLPLIVEGLDRIKDQVESGLFKPPAQASLVSVIQECCRAAQELNELLERATPSAADSSWQRMGKGIVSLTLDKKINDLDEAIKHYTDVLEFHQIAWLIATAGAKSLTAKGESTTRTFWLVPFDRNSSFVGRDTIFQAIDQAFTVSEGSQPKAALCGLGGIGKSQIALEYCYRVRGKASVFWVNAATASRFKESFNLIANECGLTGQSDSTSDAVLAVHDWLQYRYDKPWVMVIDNIDDSKAFFEDQISSDKTPWSCIPRNDQGTLLFTTRAQDIARRVSNSNPRQFVMIPKLDEDDAFSLVQRRMEEVVPYDEESIHTLLEELEYIPLAITQALAYILEHEITTTEYLGEYYRNDATRLQLIDYDFTDHGRQDNTLESVAKTWSISFKSIAKKNTPAAKLLCLISFFEHQSIPSELLLGIDYHILDDQGGLKNKVIMEDDLKRALATLRAYSFINLNGKGTKRTLSTHRLVQITTKWWLEHEGKYFAELDNWPFVALCSLARCFPEPAMNLPSNYRELCQPLLPHADLALKHNFDKVPVETKKDVDLARARLLVGVGRYLISIGDYKQGRASLEESYLLRQTHLGETHTDSMACMGLLVWLLGSTGSDISVAIRLGEHLLNLRTEILGKDHPATIDLESDHAAALAQLEDPTKNELALNMQRDAVERSERVLGRHHPDTLNCMAHLASQLHDFGRSREDCLMESISLWREVCDEKAKLLFDKIDLLASRHNLALALLDHPSLNCKEEGMTLLQSVLKDKVEAMGLDHRETLVTAHALMLSFRQCGQLQKALKLSDEVAIASYNGPRRNNEHSLQLVGQIWLLREEIEAEIASEPEESLNGSPVSTLNEQNNEWGDRGWCVK